MAALRKQDISIPEHESNLPEGYSYEQMQAVARECDKLAPRKDASMTIRFHSSTIEYLKKAAAQAGYPRYQQWVTRVVLDEAARVFGENPDDEQDD